MESGKISFGFLFILLLIFALVAGGSWLSFSGTKTGVALIDDNIAKVQTLISSEEEPGLLPIDGYAQNNTADSHDETTASTGADIPGKEGQIYNKPVNPLLGVRGLGDPNAPIQIREFFSLTCNHCAAFHEGTFPQLKQKYIDTGKVYFIFEEFPLNGPALYGSMIARCMPEGRYDSFVALLLKEQDKWAFGGDFKANLKQNAALAGMGDEEFETCFNNKDLQKAIALNIQESSDNWKISSTPSFIFNDGERIMTGVQPLESFEKVMDFLNGETTQPSVAPDIMAAPVIEETPEIMIEETTEMEMDAPVEETPAEEAPTEEEEAPELEDTSLDINELFTR